MAFNQIMRQYLLLLLLLLPAASSLAYIPLGCENNAYTQYLNSPVAKTCASEHQVCYDIVYIRYPAEDPNDPFVTISRGEHPYEFAAGADLMLLHPDGNEKILVDCDASCTITDPFISHDGKTVYFVRVNSPVQKRFTLDHRSFYSHIYKMALTGDKAFVPVQLTFNDAFTSRRYAGFKDRDDDFGSYQGINDLAPIQLADGRILFTSNRAAFIPFHPGTGGIGRSVQQLYTIDDHDGSAVTAELANMQKLENSNLHLAQHPFQLQDGRIIFSSWHDAGTKFTYAMTNLMTINPDGTDLNQFTEPHEHHKVLEHFTNQLSDGRVVATMYYPANNYGFGLIMRYELLDDLLPSEPLFLPYSIDQRLTFPDGSQGRVSFREFDRKGMVTITPHTISGDSPAPSRTGKYSMPAGTLNNDLLVAYSKGSVNFFDAACNRKDNYRCDPLQSGIYLIANAGNDSYVTSPSQLIKIKDDPNYNEIFPKPVVNYYSIHGVPLPGQRAPVSRDARLEFGEASALLGTSSMYNRQSSDGRGDPFKNTPQREIHSGTWTIQGADAGVYSNSDIYGVRIIATPAKPFTSPIRRWGDKPNWDKISHLLADGRLDNPVARYSSYHGERWEILGEFPLPHKQTIDQQGNPDTSWIAKIPAEMPTFIQTIDSKGMTLNSELTWRSLKPGEKKVDCGGCHAHATTALDYDTTESGRHAAIVNINGIADDDPRIQSGMWDLTRNSVPLLGAGNTLKFVNGLSYGVEFNRDIQPLFNKHCISCHNAQGSAAMLDLQTDAWQHLSAKKDADGTRYYSPQRSKYIRVPQARQSLLVWIAWGERLDGRTNADRDNDVDYPTSHPVLNLSDDEKRRISRWVDLGGAIDFPVTEGFGYSEDYHLPTVHIASPAAGNNAADSKLVIGFNDVHSGLNEQTIKLSYYAVPQVSADAVANTQIISFSPAALDNNNTMNMELPAGVKNGNEYILQVEISDNAGNTGIASQRFYIQ